MRAAVLSGPGGGLRLDKIEAPRPRADEVLIDVTACGICGTDLHIGRVAGAPGTVLGHEIAGRVAAVGPDVSGWAVGTSVAVRPFAGCGACSWCKRGRDDHCGNFGLLGLHRPGGFAEQVAVAARHLFRLPATLTGPDQALVEPAAVALHALRRVDLTRGEDVLVLGAGPVGLAVTAWARALGAGRIVVSDPVAARRDLATALGADTAVDPTGGDLADLTGFTGGAPVVVECTGVAGVLAQGLGAAAVDGRVGVAGICLGADQIWPYVGIHKELDVRFAIYYDDHDFVDTIDALDAGTLAASPLDLGALVTETIGLDALPERFAQLLAHPDSGKVVVTP